MNKYYIKMQCKMCAKDVTKHPKCRNRNVFCSPLCFSTWRESGKIEYKKCNSCGFEFRANINEHRIFCSRNCYEASRGIQKKQVKCGLCGSLFLSNGYKTNIGIGKFCSNGCSSKARRIRDEERYSVDKYGCWIWNGHIDKHGYGKTSRDGISISSHQYFYNKIKGEIPEGLELDHICRNTSCCNPSHMKLVTHHENVLRGNKAGMNSQKAEAIKDMNGLGGFRGRIREISRAFRLPVGLISNLI